MMPVKEKIQKKDNKEKIPTITKDVIPKPKSIACFYGINKNEIDGLTYQKKVRNEW